ncbi:isocitrate/isopropylmalate family dehydrogenase [Geodermatophilus sp. DSM 44513]|uniref:isocitrate/isopropylmalate dehydrogenase family protein n=1 Tax=Geodermatophilus sp. DSM 44513 TaxID=1528104 RepID=UPI0028F6D32B|nr:isocitrate/isopropylmalate family dehydrogenase [Geodermatophilus sp. DSM 44513]WNV74159.1 isocitrate/isopropylmalate family dehydrogenase [Geodermatophilus sp. DSM 44513]
MTGGRRLGCLLGDGIGPEVVPAARRVVDAALSAAGAPAVEWVDLPMGAAALAEHGAPLPAPTLEALAGCDGWLAGPHDSESYPPQWRASGQRVPGGELRHVFGLHTNLRPSRTRPGVPARVPAMDLVVVRENSEGFYADRNMAVGSGEFMPTPDLALVVGVFSRPAVRRAVRQAFALAARRRGQVTLVHKANVLHLAFGLWLEECRAAAREHPGVRLETVLFDAMAARLVRHPERFDVVVTENLFGDTLSDLAGELAGALGMSGSVNAGDRHAMAQAAHGSAPDIAGQDVANPVGMVVSAAMLLAWLGERHADPVLAAASSAVEQAVDAVLASGVATRDVGGTAGTAEFTDAVVDRLSAPGAAAPAVGRPGA